MVSSTRTVSLIEGQETLATCLTKRIRARYDLRVTTTPDEQHYQAMAKGYNLLDSALSCWDDLRAHHKPATLQQWGPEEYLSRVFPRTNNTIILREQGAVAACLTYDDVLFAFPFTWPRATDASQSDTSKVTSADFDDLDDTFNDEFDDEFDDTTANAFDSGLSESAHGSSSRDLIFNAFVPAITKDPAPRLADLLAIEAIIRSTPANEHTALRTLLGLRGIHERPLCDAPAHHPHVQTCPNMHRIA